MLLVFGTDGWRDVIADGFTVARVRRAVHGYAAHLLAEGPGLVLVAHDTRFGGARFAHAAAEVLTRAGHEVRLHRGPLPTPVLSFAVRHLGARGAVMLTASHNTADYNGVKLKGPYGGTADTATYEDVARRANAIVDDDVEWAPLRDVAPFDVREDYFAHVASLLDLAVLRAWRGTLVHDAMHGAAAGWIADFVRWAELPCTVEAMRADPDPLFGGGQPEPMPAQLHALRDRLRGADPARTLGVATDGDGDRLGVVTAGSGVWTSHQVLALLVDHLQRLGGTGRVVHTVTVSRLVPRLARARGLEVTQTGVGFKHLVAELLRGDVLVAGEESGGFAVRGHVPERDGILNALLVLEALASAGDLDVRFAALEREARWRHAYDRRDLEVADDSTGAAVMAALADAPATFAGARVVGVERLDGVRLDLEGDRWVLFRASGTERVLRLYCEAPDGEAVARTLDAAEAFVALHDGTGGAARSPQTSR
ncbi:MAG: phosphoglucomutase/phosphomannomutase family protein [Trueperaceae bacterium]|nr:phosphoglucomutase/phosphomannomutase family protein [Trueperaceae bacterium]